MKLVYWRILFSCSLLPALFSGCAQPSGVAGGTLINTLDSLNSFYDLHP